MRARSTCLSVLLLLLALARSVAAEPAPIPAPGRVPHLILPAPRTLCKDGLTPDAPKVCRELPPGHFVDNVEWQKLDAAIVDRDKTIARLKAENDVYKKNADTWSPGWKTLVGAVVTGISVGVYAATR